MELKKITLSLNLTDRAYPVFGWAFEIPGYEYLRPVVTVKWWPHAELPDCAYIVTQYDTGLSMRADDCMAMTKMEAAQKFITYVEKMGRKKARAAFDRAMKQAGYNPRDYPGLIQKPNKK